MSDLVNKLVLRLLMLLSIVILLVAMPIYLVTTLIACLNVAVETVIIFLLGIPERLYKWLYNVA